MSRHFNRIGGRTVYPETVYGLYNKMRRRFKRFLCMDRNIKILHMRESIRLKIISSAIMDTMDFFKIDIDEFWHYYEQWPSIEKELWVAAQSLDDFYASWNNEAARSNVCANVINQLLYREHLNAISQFFPKGGIFIDYGCGTGSLTFGLIKEKKLTGTLFLSDVENDINEYVTYRIKKHSMHHHIKFINMPELNTIEKADGMVCIDVLEHVLNPSELLIDKISPLIKKGGVLMLRAPWRGQLTHIDEAADNFYREGGRRFLSKNYKEIYRFGDIDIACIYRKAIN